MQKKKNIKSISTKDIVISSFCLLGMAASLFLFWKDLNISLSKTNEQPIAFIYFKKNTAQRRLQNKNIWERLQQASPIYNGDRIRTASASEAYTIFDDGNRLDIHENTLIQVFATKDGERVQFIDGAISVVTTNTANTSTAGKSKLNIVNGTKIVSFTEGTEATLSVQENKTVTTTILSGAATVATTSTTNSSPITTTDLFSILTSPSVHLANKQQDLPVTYAAPLSLTAGTSVVINTQHTDAKATVFSEKETKPIIYLPTSTYSLTHESGQTPYLPVSWNSFGTAVMQFSHSVNFDTILFSSTLPRNTTTSYLPLSFAEPQDILYWRVVSNDADNTHELYPSGILFIKLPEQTNISTIALSTFSTQKAATLVNTISPINSTPTDRAVSILQTKKTEAQQEQLSEEAKTNAQEKIQSESKPHLPRISVSTEKTTAKNSSSAITSITPVLTSPAAGKTFMESDFSSNNPHIQFLWGKIADAQSYTFTILYASKIIFQTKIKTTSFSFEGDNLSLLEDGKFTWTVTAFQTIDGTSYQSATASSDFTISLSHIDNVKIDTSTLLNAH